MSAAGGYPGPSDRSCMDPLGRARVMPAGYPGAPLRHRGRADVIIAINLNRPPPMM